MKDTTFSSTRLLELYDRISDAEDAIPRLRRFVLDLAVRGKLVEQDAADEPAAELLKRIAQEKARLLKAGEIGKFKARDQISHGDLAFAIPPPWRPAFVEAVLNELQTGPFGSSLHQSDYCLGGIPVINPASLQDGRIVPIEKMAVDITTLERLASFKLRPGDIVLARRGEMGRCAIVTENEAGWLCGTGSLILRPSTFLCARFLVLVIGSPFGREYLGSSSIGSTMQNLNQSILLNLPFGLPPLAEQHRIVAKVDELMALCDQLEQARAGREAVRDRLTTASLARLTAPETDAEAFQSHARFALQSLPTLTTRPDQIKTLRQTILNLAVRGKLVAQDAADEPAAELLKRFKAGKDALKKETGDARIRLAPDAKREGYPLDLPLGWEVQSFENLFLFIDYRGNTPPKTEGGVPLITAKNVRMGALNREPREYISEQTFEKWMTRGFPRLGDLFFTTEAPLANVCLNDIEEPFALAQRVICFQPYATIDTRYLMLALTSEVMQALIDGQATGMTAKGIKAAKLKPLPIPLPPLAEQHRIVAKVDALMTLCDQLEASLTTTAATRSKLLNALLHEALEPAAETADA
ncbi:hypothetical protein P775_25340 [Puniceibacterium antarcticum]|uniref:Type I restriction modification DNA specificity domain-containing protein n=1 Tax=Puniceibacterium antarcticum TaxID=1206336 RepID=A0A2G8R418_9RHOB|nr:restriction endonuclease subunit S [Puniceibacterium antarcticum]PIL16287.1 hypothetical protein P775_25340 [Puniceibacterium antarcticum]